MGKRNSINNPAPNSKRRHNLSAKNASIFCSPEFGMAPKCPSVYLKTFGCQMNVRDSEVVCGLLTAGNYRLTAKPEEADVVIFNTCSVRQHAEDKVWSEIGRVAKFGGQSTKNGESPPRPLIGLIGCMAQNYKEAAFERSAYLDFVVGPADIGKIPGILEKLLLLKKRGESPKKGESPLFFSKIWETDGQIRPEEIYHTAFYADKQHAYVVISEGCSNFCSYCVVPYVRGGLHNRHHQDILQEIRLALKKGITRFTLLGQNVNAYCCGEVDFIRLLRSIDNLEGVEEVGFITSHPRDTSLELFTAMEGLKKIRKDLHLPAQSGSDRILKLMNRGYTRKMYLDLAGDYRKMVKGGGLTTDLIVGFPGESEKDFQETLDLVKEVRFDAAYIFKYSPRPHTAALSMADTVPKQEKERRHRILLELQKSISKVNRIQKPEVRRTRKKAKV